MKTDRDQQQDGLVRYLMEKWGVSRGRVWQIEQNALRKIRNAVLNDPELRELAGTVLRYPPQGESVSLDRHFNRPPSARAERAKKQAQQQKERVA